MTSPINAVREWLEADPTWTAQGFSLMRGMWQDDATNSNKRIAQLMMTPARQPGIDTFYDGVSLLLLGPQRGRIDAPKIEQIAIDLRKRLETDFKACGVAQIRLVSGIVGPGYTAEKRPWYELQLEVIT